MARINLNEFGGQAGGVAYRVNQVRTDPAVVQAAQEALRDVKAASRSCSVLAREASASWQRTRPTPQTTPSGASYAGRSVPPAQSTPTRTAAPHGSAPDQQDRPAYPAAS